MSHGNDRRSFDPTPGAVDAAPALETHRGPVSLERPLLMGVVNATSNSFSDAGRYVTTESRIERIEQLVADGADLIDVGAQSAITTVPEEEVEREIEALRPLVRHLVQFHPTIPISVDSYKPAVSAPVLDDGVWIVNDTTGLVSDGMVELVAATGAGAVVMHNAGRPKERLTKADLYQDVVADVDRYLALRLDELAGRGIDSVRTVIDPGPDFSKTPEQTVRLLQAMPTFRRHGRPVLLAISRKDFIGAIAGRPPDQRLAGTLASIGFLGRSPGTIYRVHDVAAVRDFWLLQDVLGGSIGVDPALELPPSLRRLTAGT